MKFKKCIHLILIGIIVLLTSCDTKNVGFLTQKEKSWLKQHPNIKIAVSTSFPPFQFIDEEQKSIGISIDILNLLEENIDYTFEKVYFNNWKNILTAGKTKQVDVILEIQETVDRKNYFHFTKPFISIPHVIIMRKNTVDQISIDELENLQIGVVNNYAVQEYIKDFYPELKLYPLPDDLTCLQALSNQKIDAVITQQGYASYEIYKEVISNLQIVGNIGYDNELGFAIRKDWAILTRILDKGLARIQLKEKNAIINKWIPIHPIPFWQSNIFWGIMLLILIGLILFFAMVYLWNKSLRRRVAIKTHQLTKLKEKAEESNRLKSSFLANMSHEIRTPMNAIQGFSELIITDKLSPEQKERYSQIISKNCDSLSNLVDEILDLSQIESGLITITNQEFELINCIEEVIYSNSINIPKDKNIQIIFSNQFKQDSLLINTDPLRFKQILNNLLNNAIKFTNQGDITITGSFSDINELQFCVQDHGIGIEKSALNSIFDRFRKIENDTTVLYRGSGLGLNICKKLLELMDGQIWVKSTIGTGSSFYFTLPIKP
ncbi:MAG: transporter substrate-binding domain-containing protein [Labilibaculum sp.]|nr:transporter substrate-binding domain-containing protein [Labilibaculum sp.]MBI9057456.1 transporter substrate-binding domain-containing protein [Labilibaculum sp.]